MAIQSGDPAVDRLIARRADVTKVAAPTKPSYTPPKGAVTLDAGGVTLSQQQRQTAANLTATNTGLQNPAYGAIGVATGAAGGAGGVTGASPTIPSAPITNQGDDLAKAKAFAASQTADVVPTQYDDSLSGFTEADISASLAAIEAEYGLTREELLRDQTMIGAQYRLLTAQLSRQRQLALEGAEAGALQRGLFRSGIFAAEAGQVEGQFGEAQAQLAQETLGKEGEIISQLETLEARQGNAQAQEAQRIRKAEYEARLAAAGL